MFKSHKNAVTVVGAENKAIEGEYLAKGTISANHKSRIFVLLVMFVVSLFLVPLQAMAEVPAAVTTAITTAVTDVTTIGTAILGVVVVIAAFFWMRRPIK
jgi:hypothetical protein